MITPFESCEVGLEPLPLDISQEALIELLEPIGNLQRLNITTNESQGASSAIAEFSQPFEAERAVMELNETSIFVQRGWSRSNEYGGNEAMQLCEPV